MAKETELKVQLTADSKQLDAKLQEVQKQLGGLGGGSTAAEIQKNFKGIASEASNIVAVFTGDRLTGATSQLTSFGEAFGAIAGPAGLAVGAVAGFALVAFETASKVFELTRSAAEYGDQIYLAATKTGFSAQMMTALKIAADASGSSVESVSSGVAKFAKLIGKAAAGNAEAQDSLKKLGVTSYDLDTALGQVTKTIYNADAGTQQITLSQKAFGKAGADMIPTITQAGGSIEEYQKNLERLHATLTEKDIVAAHGFMDALNLLAAQAHEASAAFTTDLMVVLAKYFADASEWYARNESEIRFWGATIADVVDSFARGMGIAFDFIGRHAAQLREYLAEVTFGISELVIEAGKLLHRAEEARLAAQFGGSKEGIGRAINPSDQDISTPKGKGGGGGGKETDKSFAEAKKRAEELIKIYKESSDSRSAYNDLALETMGRSERAFAEEKASIEADRLAYEKQVYGDILNLEHNTQAQREEIQAKLDELTTKSYAQRLKSEKELHAAIVKDKKEEAAHEAEIATFLAKLYTDATARAAERAKNEQEDATTTANVWIAGYQRILDNQKSTFAERKAAYDHIVQIQLDLGQKMRAAENAFHQERMAGIKSEPIAEFEKNQKLEAEERRHAAAMAGIRGQTTPGATPTMPNPFKETVKWLKDAGPDGALMQTVKQFADGIGQIVQNLILMGDAGPQAMKKLVASVLAGVAAQAAVQAVMFTAYGLVALTPWGAAIYGPATQWFEGAALMASIAVGAGFAGRKIAGDSFKNTANAATGGASSNSNAPDYYTHPQAITRTGSQASTPKQEANVYHKTMERVANALDRFEAMSAGDVLTVGAGQKRGFIAQTVATELRGNAGHARAVNIALGNT